MSIGAKVQPIHLDSARGFMFWPMDFIDHTTRLLTAVVKDDKVEYNAAAEEAFRVLAQYIANWEENGWLAAVEVLAQEIYSTFPYDEGMKPNWQPGGNSYMQEKARDEARRRLEVHRVKS